MPDRDTALIISSIIDRARAAMGWNALPQTSVSGQQSPQDLAIISWFEICSDAGMRLEQYQPCYRAAQSRKRELLAQGKELTVVTPYDLCAELDRVRAMHRELDNTRLLPETAASVCPRCDGTEWERMPDGSRRKGCKHEFADEDAAAYIVERDAELVKTKAAEMRDALSKMATVKSIPVERIADKLTVVYRCEACGREGSSEFGWNSLDVCGQRLPGPVREDERLGCPGRMVVGGSPIRQTARRKSDLRIA